MQNILALISSLVMALTGAFNSTGSTPNVTGNATRTDSSVMMCYNPEFDQTITLSWNQNFQNVTDPRAQLNPGYFSGKPNSFNTDSTCKAIAMHGLDERTYIRVRRNVRISSCKTDELSGPFNTTGTVCERAGSGHWAGADVRGSCEVTGYTDLRKVADVVKEGKNLEIFWVPLSYNVGCNYEQDNNCGPGPSSSRSNFNLKDFIYVLNRRDAFDQNNPDNCDAQWDAGSINEGACSHFFDVYMAKDIWEKVQNPVPEGDPDKNVDDFFRQAILNCKEKNYYTPIEDPNNPANNPEVISRESPKFKSLGVIAHNEWTWATPWCKPAVYLYPKKEEVLNIKLILDGELTVSNPPYNPETGWDVRATPDGFLTRSDLVRGPTSMQTIYPYLYYEANLSNIEIPKEGFVVEKEKLRTFLITLLSKIGFNDREINDFLTYWLPRLSDKPYYFVTLLPESVINAKEALVFSVTPDAVIRARVVFEGLDLPIAVHPLKNTPRYTRSGFTVTDWGGTLVGRDCRDITIQ